MKRILIILLFSFLATMSFAQKFKAGLIAGFANTDVYGTDPQDVDFNKIGFNFGAFVGLPLSEKSDIRFEMTFVEKGSYIPPPSDSTSVANGVFSSYRLRLNYINVPIIYSHKFSFNMGKTLVDKFAYEAGVNIGFLIHSDEDFNQQGPQPVFSQPPFSAYSRYDFGALLGFSFRISDDLKFHFRYENSILPIRPHPGGATSYYAGYYNSGQTNMAFIYTLSYTF